MKYATHWEPPLRDPLLITVHRLATILDVPHWKANEISWCLDRRFIGEGGRHLRVTMASVQEYLALEEAGLPAREVMSQRKSYGWSPTERHGLTPKSATRLMRSRQRTGG